MRTRDGVLVYGHECANKACVKAVGDDLRHLCSPFFDGIWEPEATILESGWEPAKNTSLPTPPPTSGLMPRPPHRRPGNGRDGYGSSPLLPRGRDGQMPTWQRLGLAGLPLRLGQGLCPRARWNLGPLQRVRWPEVEALAGRGLEFLRVE